MAIHTSTINIHTSAQKVFEVLTKPDLVKLWQFERVLNTDWKVGSDIKFSVYSEGKALEQWGKVLEMKPNELIKYNLFTPQPGLEDKIENYCVTSYILKDNKGQTTVDIVQEDNRPYGFAAISLNPILASLKHIAETH